MDIRTVLALNLRNHRKRQGLSQKELADRAEIDRTYISALEHSSNAASIDVVDRLAQVLQLKPSELLTHPALQQSPDEISRAWPPIGSEGNHVVEIPVSTLPLHECGARLFSFFAFPEINSEDYRKRKDVETAICNMVLRRKAQEDPVWTSSVQAIRPSHLLLSEQDAGRCLRTFNKIIHHRFAVARVAGLMIAEGLGEAWLNKTPEEGKHFSMRQVSEFLVSHVGEKDPVNILSRVWARSFPVVHLALALMWFFNKTSSSSQRGQNISKICLNKDDFLYVLEGAEQFEYGLSYAPTLCGNLYRLIHFRAT